MEKENIKFTYADNVKQDPEREKQSKDMCNQQWFEPLIEQINDESGEISITLLQGINCKLAYFGSDELKAKVMERWKIYQVPSGNLDS